MTYKKAWMRIEKSKESLIRVITGTIMICMFIMVQGTLAATVGIADDSSVVGGGARPLGMGKAFTAISDDPDAPFLNPAGIAGLKKASAMAMFTNILGEVYYSEFCAATPSKFGTLGIGYVTTGVGNIPTTIGAVTGYADYYDNLLVASYSSPLSRFLDTGRDIYLGANLKFFSRGFTGPITNSASGLNMDLSFKYLPNPYVNFGVVQQNILPDTLGGIIKWGGGTDEALLSVTKIGVALKPKPFKGNMIFAFDANVPSVSTRPTTFHLGAEWKIHPNFALRTGFDQTIDAANATGTAWNMVYGCSIGYAGYRLDYAYHPYYNYYSGSGLNTSYVSISYSGEPVFLMKGDVEPLVKKQRGEKL